MQNFPIFQLLYSVNTLLHFKELANLVEDEEEVVTTMNGIEAGKLFYSNLVQAPATRRMRGGLMPRDLLFECLTRSFHAEAEKG